MPPSRARTLVLIGTLLLVACRDSTGPRSSQEAAPGAPRSATTTALETGADLLQPKGPIGTIAMHMVGFHPAKDDPAMQMESHHYCNQVNQDFAQCVLYDGDTPHARLHGIEFIISARLYATLPPEELPYWHPHNYEILSGTLRLPRLPDAAEHATLRDKVNSYGKTWHVWKTGVHGQAADALPLGPAHLAWSFNRDGEARPGLIEERDRRMGLDTNQARQRRADLVPLARPQGGIDAMHGQFPSPTTPIAGVHDSGDARTRAVPRVVIDDTSRVP